MARQHHKMTTGMKALVLRGADRWQVYTVAVATPAVTTSVRAYTRPGTAINPLDALSHSIFIINIWGEFHSFPFLHMREMSPREFK